MMANHKPSIPMTLGLRTSMRNEIELLRIIHTGLKHNFYPMFNVCLSLENQYVIILLQQYYLQ